MSEASFNMDVANALDRACTLLHACPGRAAVIEVSPDTYGRLAAVRPRRSAGLIVLGCAVRAVEGVAPGDARLGEVES